MDSAEHAHYRFDDYRLDEADRQLWRGSERIELSARYLDALLLLVREAGQLVEKDRFFGEVWDDVVVSDSALTQCIKEIRRALGDDAAKPRFVQTVPRHGYRFIARVHGGSGRAVPESLPAPWKAALRDWGSGTLGGGVAGVLGGLVYGFGLASASAGVGTLSTLLVLIVLNVIAGLTGGLGVAGGLAAAGMIADRAAEQRTMLTMGCAAFGGLFVGAFANLVGVDAFNLLFGQAPEGITGGGEGAILGAAIAFGSELGRRLSLRRRARVIGAGLMGLVAGVLIPLSGGRLMAGSLHLLSESFAGSNLQVERLGAAFGDLAFGLPTQMVLSGFEAMTFAVCVVGAMVLLRRR